MGNLIGIILSLTLIFFGGYGLILDIVHGHLLWAVVDFFTSGFTAVIRGIGYYFDFIGY